MTKATRETLLTFFYLALGIAGAAVAGYLILGKYLTRDPNLLLRFVIVGFSGSLIYAAVQLRGLGFAVLMVALFFFGQLALTPPLSANSAITAAIWTLPIGALFLASAYLFKALRRVPIGRFLLMALLVAIGYGLATVIYLLKSHAPIAFAPVYRQAFAGFRVGGLVGLGMELVELMTRGRVWHEPAADEAVY